MSHHHHHDWGIASLLGLGLAGMATVGAAQKAGGSDGIFIGALKLVGWLAMAAVVVSFIGLMGLMGYIDSHNPHPTVAAVVTVPPPPPVVIAKLLPTPLAAIPEDHTTATLLASALGGGALVLLIVGGLWVKPHFEDLTTRYYKFELEFGDGWRKHHIPTATRDEAIFEAGKFVQALDGEAVHYRVVKTNRRADRCEFKARIEAWAGAGDVEQALAEMKRAAESEATVESWFPKEPISTAIAWKNTRI